MSPVDAVRSAFRQYGGFRGRARRSEYWWFTRFTVVLSVATSVLDRALFGTGLGQTGVLSALATLAVLVPGLALAWRRLHDTGRSGLWNLIALVPVVGWVVVLVFVLQDSEPGADRFGPSPEGGAAWTPGYGPGYLQP